MKNAQVAEGISAMLSSNLNHRQCLIFCCWTCPSTFTLAGDDSLTSALRVSQRRASAALQDEDEEEIVVRPSDPWSFRLSGNLFLIKTPSSLGIVGGGGTRLGDAFRHCCLLTTSALQQILQGRLFLQSHLPWARWQDLCVCMWWYHMVSVYVYI